MQSRLRYGMVGGAGESYGMSHRQAAALSNDYELVCGAFSRDLERSIAVNEAENLAISSQRIYHSYQELIQTEASLPIDTRMQVLAIVTPNNSHFAIAKMAIEHGFDIIIEKPITCTLAEAEALKILLETHQKKCLVGFVNSGFPILQSAKDLLASDELGAIRIANISYLQGWLSQVTDNPRARWRMDPKISGPAGTLADLGSHAFHLLEYVTGLEAKQLFAQLSRLHPEHVLDDYANVQLQFNAQTQGQLQVSQVATGEANNNFSLAVYCAEGSLKWHHQNPNELLVTKNDQLECLTLDKLQPGCMINTAQNDRLMALARLYKNFARDLNGQNGGYYPSIAEGVRNMAFIEAALASNRTQQVCSIEKADCRSYSKLFN